MTMFEAEWTKQENGKNQKKSSLIGMYFYSRAKHFWKWKSTKLWRNITSKNGDKTQNNCDKTQYTNCDKTQNAKCDKKKQFWHRKIVMKPKLWWNTNCDKTHNLQSTNCDKTQNTIWDKT